MSMREALKAAATLLALVAIAWIAGVRHWLLTGLWAFIAAWSLRMGLHLFGSTRRRALLVAGTMFALGAACGAAMYVFWDRQSAALPLAVAAAALIGGSLVIGVADWRRNAA
jgi:hypothetical protein